MKNMVKNCTASNKVTMNKLMSAKEIASRISSGETLMLGGFASNRGYPGKILYGLVFRDVTNLSIITNAASASNKPELEKLLEAKVSSLTCTYLRTSKAASDLYKLGKVTLIPQGTLAESIRLGGLGIPAYYNSVGVGTAVAKGKEVREFNSKLYLLEHAITGDKALIRVNIADKSGNCFIKGPSKTFSPLMAAACKEVYIEAEEIVEVGEIDPELVTIPNILVNGIVDLRKE